MTALFPISLGRQITSFLVEKYAKEVFSTATRFHYSGTIYDFESFLYPDKGVKLAVTFNYDDGCIASGGHVLNHTIYISDEEFNRYVENEKIQLAEAEYDRIQDKKRKDAILKIKNKMFPVDKDEVLTGTDAVVARTLALAKEQLDNYKK